MVHTAASPYAKIVRLFVLGLLWTSCASPNLASEEEPDGERGSGARPLGDAGSTRADAAARPGGGDASVARDGSTRVPGAPDDSGTVPQPGAEPVPSLLGDVAFSVPSQTFREPLRVALSTSMAGAEIRYTTDGKLPSPSAARYDAPLTIERTTQLRAQAFVAGAPQGAVSTALYIARTFDFASDLPIAVVDGYGGGKPSDKNVYKDAAIMIFEPVDGTASLSALPVVASRAGYHVRGQSSARFPQTPYRVELWDNAGDDADYPVLGMPADADWVLIPPYYDRSLIRNPLVYELGQEMGLEAPRTRFVELYVNAENRPLAEADYQGVYWLEETIKNSRSRVNLKQLRADTVAATELSGGYIFKFDQAATEEPTLACTGAPPIANGFGVPVPGMMAPPSPGAGATGGTCWVDLEVVDPDPLAPAQAAWLTEYIQAFHDALHATPIGDYAQYIDVPSFVDYLIINELTRNVDSYVRSAFYHKDRDGKIKAGPLWDYNFSLAVGGANTIDPNGGWHFQGARNVNDWYPKLTKDPAFMAQVRERWRELRAGPLSQAALEQRIAQLSAPLARAVVRDYAKWPVSDVLRPGAFVRGPTVATWEGQLDALREFVRARGQWMDGQLE